MPAEPPDAVRFSLMWGQAQGAVSGYLHGLLPDRQSADELIQEVAVAAFRNFAQWQPSGTFTAWTLGIARNLLKMRWRSLARSRTVIADPELIDRFAEIHAELDEAMESEKAALRACLDTVRGRSWELLRLRYVEGMAPAAVAERLALAAGTVRVQLHRIRTALRVCIERRLAAGGGDG